MQLKQWVFLGLLLTQAVVYGQVEKLALHGVPASEVPRLLATSQIITEHYQRRHVPQESLAKQLRAAQEVSYDAANQLFHQRFVQYHHGVPVIGGEVNLHSQQTRPQFNRQASATGVVYRALGLSAARLQQLNTEDLQQMVLQQAKTWFASHYDSATWNFHKPTSRLVVGILKGQATPLYEVHFFATATTQRPREFYGYFASKAPYSLLQWWDATPHWSAYHEKGRGGNEKTGLYIYAKNKLPSLPVSRRGDTCILDSPTVRLVSLAHHTVLDGENDYLEPLAYPCGSDHRDDTDFMGAFEPANDAYFFGHLIVDFYKKWYHTPPLPFQLVLRIHHLDPFRTRIDDPYYDNAFWSNQTYTMNFGDGDPNYFYPLIALDVTAHEVSHGFTALHADLAYHDQSGALNESFSDMAGITAKRYLLEKYPELYQRIYHKDVIEWTIGESITRNRTAIRYLDHPARDSGSAECAEQVTECARSYNDMVARAKGRQMSIVHLGSGVYNRAFMLLASKPHWGIRKTFKLMLTANRDGYWTRGALEQDDYFNQAACGLLAAARSLHYSTRAVYDAFKRVGLLTHYQCQKTTQQ